MVKQLGKDVRCSIARSLEVLGERWTLLVVREAFWGRTRFSQFRESLGVAPDILSDRLATLVDYGVLERRAYRAEGERERDEYVLTPAGQDLSLVLGALNAWGDRHRPAPAGSAASYVEAATRQPVELRFVSLDGRLVDSSEVKIVRNVPVDQRLQHPPGGPPDPLRQERSGTGSGPAAGGCPPAVGTTPGPARERSTTSE